MLSEKRLAERIFGVLKHIQRMNNMSDNNELKISIVIPVYNSQSTIGLLVDKLIRVFIERKAKIKNNFSRKHLIIIR